MNTRRPAPTPPGHYSRLASPSAIPTFARVAFDGSQPAFVRSTHAELLRLSLAQLAEAVRSVSPFATVNAR